MTTTLVCSSEVTPAVLTTPCPRCGKPYRTLVKRSYCIQIVGGIKQSVPLGSQWRCMACGNNYMTEDA